MEERNELIKELFELHKLLADKGEISIGYGFSENYERLEAKVKNLTIPDVVVPKGTLCKCGGNIYKQRQFSMDYNTCEKCGISKLA